MKRLHFILILAALTMASMETVFAARFLKTYGSFQGCSGGFLQGVSQPSTFAERTQLVHWENGSTNIPLFFNESAGPQNVSFTTARDEVMLAAASWSNVSTSFKTFSHGSSIGGQIDYTDNLSTLIWFDNGSDPIFDICLNGVTIAITIITTNSSSELLDVDIAFNDYDYVWKKYTIGEPDNWGVPDIQAVAAHELGHLLGLAHSDPIAPSPTMKSPYFGYPGRFLQADDADGATYLYRKNITVPTQFPTLAAAAAYASQGSGQIITIQGSGTFIIDQDVTIKSGITITCQTGVSLQVQTGKTLTMEAGSRMELPQNSTLTVNGKLVATNTVFTSTSPSYLYWYGIYLNGGPNVLTNCTIEYAIYGLILLNNTSTTTIQYSFITHCQNYGIYSYNSGNGTLNVLNCSMAANAVAIGLAGNSWASLEGVYISGSPQFGFYVLNSQLFMKSVTIEANYGFGLFVEGSSANVRFSPNGTLPGWNQIKNNLGGQVRRTGGTVLIGKILPPYVYAGYNSISGANPWVKNDGSGGIYAHLTYWGSPYECPPQSSHFVGSVYRTYPLGCVNSIGEQQPMALVHSYNDQQGNISDGSVSEDSLLTIAMIKDMLRVIRDYPDSAEDAIPILSTYFDHQSEYASLLPTSWDSYLARVSTTSRSPMLRTIARVYQIQAMMNTRKYEDAVGLINTTLSTTPDDQLWFYCKTQLIGAYLGLNDFTKVEGEYLRFRNRGSLISETGTAEIGRVINLVSRIPSPSTVYAGVIEEEGKLNNTIPSVSKLLENYPNPFNPITRISYDLVDDVPVHLVVYDVIGRIVRVLINEIQSAGFHSVSFDASYLPSGIYYYRIQAGRYSDVKKMMLLK